MMIKKKKKRTPQRGDGSTAAVAKAELSSRPRPVSIVGIGASAGGLEAFGQLLSTMPEDTGMGFVLVQHLSPNRESILSELLAKSTRLPVVEVTDGAAVLPNHVYVIPPNVDMSIKDGILHLTPRELDRARRMPIDSFLRSLADDQQGRAIAVILSGTASDGTLGTQAIKAAGGVTFAQDDASAKYNAMPRSAIAAGHVDFVLQPSGIARELQRISKHVHVLVAEETAPPSQSARQDEALNKIFTILRNFSRVDFSYYKPGTIRRRITRRMFLRKVEKLDQYVQLLQKNHGEVEALFNDLLINVTGFFRDPDAFETLRQRIFPLILNSKTPNAVVRVWVPGCSTGEEAYSLAIVLQEYLTEKSANFQIQIFATDISDAIIQKARVGLYPDSITQDISPERLHRFFQKMNGGYQISKSIRDICVFAKQDIAKDPPFSKLDLVSCRNVMIYMGPVLQKRIIPVFHYALNPEGILFLGSSESVGGFGDLFDPVDKKYKIYKKKNTATPSHLEFVPAYEIGEKAPPATPPATPREDLQKTASQILLNRYAPASVVVNERYDILQFMGQTGRFLDPAPGEASLNILKLVKAGLQFELRLALQKAKRNGPVRKERILVERDGMKSVSFEVLSMKSLPGQPRYYLVTFEEGDGVGKTAKTSAKATTPPKKGATTSPPASEADVGRLRDELESTRQYLQSIIEEQRTTNEELRSANEEIQSSNEELQSINEELETAKEELQSTNEELTTVNDELLNRNDELTQVNNDLSNLLASVNIPIVMLGNDLRIRRFTPMSEKIMNLIPGDIGRPISDIKSNLKLQDLRQMVARVVDTLEIQEAEVQDSSGKWYSMRLRPYRTLDNRIDGVVMMLFDLDVRLRPKS
jgi:two-component system CheB/CheR fusion protein